MGEHGAVESVGAYGTGAVGVNLAYRVHPLEKQMTILERFMNKVKIPADANACWEWQAARAISGLPYGQFRVGRSMQLAHRVSYELFNQEKPGECVMHTCDNPGCVNPAHLVSGNYTLNNRDCVAKRRHASTRKDICKRGHPLSGDNLVVRQGKRQCRKCENNRSKEYKRRKNEQRKNN